MGKVTRQCLQITIFGTEKAAAELGTRTEPPDDEVVIHLPLTDHNAFVVRPNRLTKGCCREREREGGGGGGETDRQRDRERQRERETDRQTDRQTETERS